MAPRVKPLRALRLRRGVTIRQLEVATGINRGRLSIIERGVTPTADERARILAALAEPAEPERPPE